MNEEENEQLIEGLLEGDISEADFLRLEAELIVSPEAREAYYERLKLHTGLQDEARSNNASLPGTASASTGSRPRKLDPILFGAIGALILLVLALTWKLIAGNPQPISEPVASGYGVIAELSDAKWKTGSELSKGDLLPAQPVNLTEGRAKIELFNGVKLVVEDSTSFTLVSETELQLSSGRVQVMIPKVAQSFQVTTPQGTLERTGSEFAVEAQEDKTVIDVLEATADWNPNSSEIKIILAGTALHWDAVGNAEIKPTTAIPMAEVEAGFNRKRASRLEDWIKSRQDLLSDQTLLAYYAIENADEKGPSLRDLSKHETIGAVVLADQAPDRWNRSQSALDFSPMGSRVRVTIPEEHQSLSLMCWVKIDSLDRLYNSLFLTDGHELHEPHWQILNDGRIFFSVRANSTGKGKDKHIAYSPPIWSPARSGQWMHLATVYDGEAFTITHYVNGEAVSIDQIPEEMHPEKVTIGAASIGNWSEPRYRKDAEFAVRNLNGSIDELGIWSRPLGAGEVREWWRMGRP